MDDKYPIISISGIRFNLANCLSVLVSAVLVFALVFFLSRKIALKPTKRQNILEWIIDFTNGIVKSAMPGEEGKQFYLFAFVMFMFVFISNQLGLILQIKVHDVTWLKSPTANPIITMSLAMIVLVIAHYFSVERLGFGNYMKSYIKPVGFFLPINIIEQFTNFLTLSLRLYGNIFAGEVLLSLLVKMAFSHGPATMLVTAPIQMVWQGFSVFIGAIQAYVFVTLSIVYISEKVEMED